MVESDVQFECVFECAFHFFDGAQGADGLSSSQLSEVKPEVIAGLGKRWMAACQLSADGDAFSGELSSLDIIGGVLGEIEACAGEFPCSVRVIGLGIETGLCVCVGLFGSSCEGRGKEGITRLRRHAVICGCWD